MIDDPHKKLAQLAVVQAEKRLLRASSFYEKQAAAAVLTKALTWLEQVRGDQ